MNKEEITKEDILNVTGNVFDTMLDYVDNSNKELEQLQQENKQLKQMIDEQDGCNKRRLQIFSLKDKLCKELKNVKNLKQENKQLKERLERIDNYLDKNYTMENQYWFDHIRDVIKDR